MAATLDLELVRKQCNIVADVDDALLQQYVAAALAHVEQHCDRKLVEGEPAGPDDMKLTADVVQAALLLVGHWVANREAVVVGEVSTEVQFGVERLLWYRKTF
ncbi:head-tail connector protein [Stenotrophomonas maltophilia]|uniref:head-tail connector protein n=1 Tax=Stenotrophomonas maltophilia TaxID=40324 RepID=UPI001F38CC6A|nr:head-tail connector protein [Stenotrophomonas maltophilia]MCF3524549.1 phage gp6-like head-tail connector protein [Stenotrophomonas maltophilia]MCF3553292.1 phage gp6-like head-tail connector protein [Stenotrophomonas maltophilia]